MRETRAERNRSVRKERGVKYNWERPYFITG